MSQNTIPNTNTKMSNKHILQNQHTNGVQPDSLPPKPYACTRFGCGRSFDNAHGLTMHIARAHKQGRVPEQPRSNFQLRQPAPEPSPVAAQAAPATSIDVGPNDINYCPCCGERQSHCGKCGADLEDMRDRLRL
jgi:hypothetical protein